MFKTSRSSISQLFSLLQQKYVSISSLYQSVTKYNAALKLFGENCYQIQSQLNCIILLGSMHPESLDVCNRNLETCHPNFWNFPSAWSYSSRATLITLIVATLIVATCSTIIPGATLIGQSCTQIKPSVAISNTPVTNFNFSRLIFQKLSITAYPQILLDICFVC